jgi:hypothetical protein
MAIGINFDQDDEDVGPLSHWLDPAYPIEHDDGSRANINDAKKLLKEILLENKISHKLSEKIKNFLK